MTSGRTSMQASHNDNELTHSFNILVCWPFTNINLYYYICVAPCVRACRLMCACVSCMYVFFEPIAEKMYGVRIKVFGYKGKLDDRCIMIMNHRCHLDWFFLWGLVAKLGDLSVWKTVMKRELRSLPIFGTSLPNVWICA